QFYPPAAVQLGLDLSQLIVVRPIRRGDAYRAIVESLRCSAVGAVLSWQTHLNTSDFRRLQLAAESGGSIGVLLRPIRALHMPSSAAVRLLVSPVASADLEPYHLVRRVRYVRVDVARCWGGKAGQSFVLEIDHETGHVHLPARVAPAAVVARSARTSG